MNAAPLCGAAFVVYGSVTSVSVTTRIGLGAMAR